MTRVDAAIVGSRPSAGFLGGHGPDRPSTPATTRGSSSASWARAATLKWREAGGGANASGSSIRGTRFAAWGLGRGLPHRPGRDVWRNISTIPVPDRLRSREAGSRAGEGVPERGAASSVARAGSFYFPPGVTRHTRPTSGDDVPGGLIAETRSSGRHAIQRRNVRRTANRQPLEAL